MKTSSIYSRNLKEHIITNAMISDCLFSVSKRAKNYHMHTKYYRKSMHREKCYSEIKELYDLKDKMLTILEPTCIQYDITFKRYYLFYDLGKYSFHRPISKDSLNLYSLEIREVNFILSFGEDIHQLVSLQFVRKVCDLIESNEYKRKAS